MGQIAEPRRAKRGMFSLAWPSALIAAGMLAAGCGPSPSPGAGPLKVVATFGEVGLSPGQFSYPRAMDHDGATLWIVDKSARVQHLDAATGAYMGGWRMPEFQFGKPVGITVAPGDGGESLVYIADTHCHRVMVYRPGAGVHDEPTLVAEIGSFGEAPGQFIYPTDVAVLVEPGAKSPARLYVSEYGGHDRVSVFEHAEGANSYRYAFSFGSFGESASADNVEFKRPQSIAIDAARRELIVADSCNHRVGRFTLDGRLVAWIGAESRTSTSPGLGSADGGQNLATPSAGAEGDRDRPARFQYPYGLCLRSDGTALVAEFGASRVQLVDLVNARSLGVFGVAGRGKGQLATPWAVTTIGDRVFVLDSGNNRVEAFDLPRRSERVAMGMAAEGREGRD